MNPSTTSIDLNVGLPNIAVVSYAVQGDQQARVITAHLYDGSEEWTPPAGAIGIIRFRTSLGTSGLYDTDEDGNTAVTWSGNVATLRIVQNAIAVAGCVPMQLEFYQGSQKLSSFSWMMIVEPSVLTDTEFMQTDYYNILTQQISAIITALDEIPTASTSNPLMDGTASPGTANTFSRGDHRHPSDTTRVPTTRKVNNKALSADITLTAEDIGYDDGLSEHTAGSTGKAIADLKGSLNTAENNIENLQTKTSVTKTYTHNSYVPSNGFLGSVYKKAGVIVFSINIRITTTLPDQTTNIEIGRLDLGFTPAGSSVVTLAPQSNVASTGNLILVIDTAGIVTIGNTSGLPCSGFYRGSLTIV